MLLRSTTNDENARSGKFRAVDRAFSRELAKDLPDVPRTDGEILRYARKLATLRMTSTV